MPSWHEPGESNPPITAYRASVAFLWACVAVMAAAWVYFTVSWWWVAS